MRAGDELVSWAVAETEKNVATETTARWLVILFVILSRFVFVSSSSFGVGKMLGSKTRKPAGNF